MNALENENYMKWLLLLKSYPDLPFTPTKQIDDVWHQHLKSSKYEEECYQLIGFVPKHQPCSDESELTLGFKILVEKWKHTYGNIPSSPMAICAVNV